VIVIVIVIVYWACSVLSPFCSPFVSARVLHDYWFIAVHSVVGQARGIAHLRGWEELRAASASASASTSVSVSDSASTAPQPRGVIFAVRPPAVNFSQTVIRQAFVCVRVCVSICVCVCVIVSVCTSTVIFWRLPLAVHIRLSLLRSSRLRFVGRCLLCAYVIAATSTLKAQV
jgi:hypothetical protein